jgi:hypothetical protein
MTAPRLCVVAICQAGELELKAALAIASIRAHHPESPELDLVAAVPDTAVWGTLRGDTVALLGACGARLVDIESPFGQDYPIGNKLAAVGVRTEAAATLFLDSDILCLRAFAPAVLQTAGVLAKPSDLDTFKAGPKEWQAVYGLFGLRAPDVRVVTTVSEETIIPYFNAGVLVAGNGAEFSEVWLETARIIDRSRVLPQKLPWLDQVALPVACARLRRSIGCLTEAWNYPAHLRRLPESPLPVFCHYHWPAVIAAEPALTEQVRGLMGRHPEIRALMGGYEEWAAPADNVKQAPQARPADR